MASPFSFVDASTAAAAAATATSTVASTTTSTTMSSLTPTESDEFNSFFAPQFYQAPSPRDQEQRPPTTPIQYHQQQQQQRFDNTETQSQLQLQPLHNNNGQFAPSHNDNQHFAMFQEFMLYQQWRQQQQQSTNGLFIGNNCAQLSILPSPTTSATESSAIASFFERNRFAWRMIAAFAATSDCHFTLASYRDAVEIVRSLLRDHDRTSELSSLLDAVKPLDVVTQMCASMNSLRSETIPPTKMDDWIGDFGLSTFFLDKFLIGSECEPQSLNVLYEAFKAISATSSDAVHYQFLDDSGRPQAQRNVSSTTTTTTTTPQEDVDLISFTTGGFMPFHIGFLQRRVVVCFDMTSLFSFLNNSVVENMRNQLDYETVTVGLKSMFNDLPDFVADSANIPQYQIAAKTSANKWIARQDCELDVNQRAALFASCTVHSESVKRMIDNVPLLVFGQLQHKAMFNLPLCIDAKRMLEAVIESTTARAASPDSTGFYFDDKETHRILAFRDCCKHPLNDDFAGSVNLIRSRESPTRVAISHFAKFESAKKKFSKNVATQSTTALAKAGSKRRASAVAAKPPKFLDCDLRFMNKSVISRTGGISMSTTLNTIENCRNFAWDSVENTNLVDMTNLTLRKIWPTFGYSLHHLMCWSILQMLSIGALPHGFDFVSTSEMPFDIQAIAHEVDNRVNEAIEDLLGFMTQPSLQNNTSGSGGGGGGGGEGSSTL